MAIADLTRQRLARAALEHFTTRGYEATTTAQIAKKAGVSEGAIYRHFTGKQHLLNEVYRAAVRWALELVREAEAAGGTPREQLARLAQALTQAAGREAAVVRLFFLQRHGELLDQESRDAAQQFHQGLERLLAQGKADGSVRPGSAAVWAAVWLSVVALALDRLSSREWDEKDAGVRLVLEGAWGAIAAGPSDSRTV
jgi:AcrR family transcriptional regulator